MCPESEASFCTPCISMPWIWGTFMHPVQRYAQDLRQTFGILKRYLWDFGQTFPIRKRQLWFSRLLFPFPEHDVEKFTHTNGKQKWIVHKSRHITPFQECHVPDLSQVLRSFRLLAQIRNHQSAGLVKDSIRSIIQNEIQSPIEHDYATTIIPCECVLGESYR